jgi:hypothetical protein
MGKLAERVTSVEDPNGILYAERSWVVENGASHVGVLNKV